MDRRAQPAGEGAHRAVVPYPAGPPGQRDALARNRNHRASQPLSGKHFSALVAAAFRAAAPRSWRRPPAAGTRPAAGTNSQHPRAAMGEPGPHRELAGATLGSPARPGLRRPAWSSCRDRTPTRWQYLVAFPRLLPAPATLPGRRPGVDNSFRPTASRTYRQETNPTKTKIHPESPLEDISMVQKTGHFYFALTGFSDSRLTG